MSEKEKVLRTTMVISILTVISKVLGFLRESLIGYRYGTSMEIDAYFLAMSATFLFSTFFTNTIWTTFIPTLVEIEDKEGKEGKLKHTNNMVNILILISFVMTVVGIIISPLLVRIMAKGFEGEQYELAVKLTRVGFPMLISAGTMGVFIAFLRSEHRHMSAAITGFGFNLVYIVYLIFFYDKFSITGLMVTSVVATFVQTLILLPESRKIGYRYQAVLDFKDRYIRKILRLSLPVIIGVAITDLNTIVDRTMASELATGSVASLNYANKLNGLILGVFITALTTVIFPILSEEAEKNNMLGVKEGMKSGIRLILLITIPASVGMIVLSKPIVQVAFERGAFDSRATLMTSGALKAYAVGLVAMSLQMLVVRVYYSIQDTKTPMLNGALTVAINIALNIILVKRLDHVGLALATSISTSLGLLILIYQLKLKIGNLGAKSYLEVLLKSGLASILMGLVAYFSYHGLMTSIGGLEGMKFRLLNLIILLVAVAIGVLVYALVIYIVRVDEMRELVDKLKRLIKRK